MAKKIEKLANRVYDFIFDMLCIACFTAGFLAFFFLFMEVFFDGSINFLRRNLFQVFAFAIAFGVIYPIGKIFWKNYKRELRKAQRELEKWQQNLERRRQDESI